MDYDFDEIIDRRGTHSIKWDSSEADVLPMWIADMDFKTAPAVTEALRNRVAHGVFGYTLTPPEFYEAIITWWNKRHGFTLRKDWIIPVTGVIPALSVALESLTSEGDSIILQPPVYNHFFIVAENCQRKILENNLLYDDGQYHIDFDDLEKKAADPKATLLLLCNPHNPVGRVWTAEELQRIGTICARNGVIVVSDEIHSDLVYPGYQHTPFAPLDNAISTPSITVSSPSKTFNLAGLQVGYLFTEHPDLRKRIEHVMRKRELALLNPFAITALIAAYQQGEEWLEGLKTYLANNFSQLEDFCVSRLPQLKTVPLQATYLAWLDCSDLGVPSTALTDHSLKNEKLWIIPGTLYGHAGADFLRINIACPRSMLMDGLSRLERACTAR